MTAEKCSKCHCEGAYVVKYAIPKTSGFEYYQLCNICNNAFDQQGALLIEFLKEDFGKFPISEVSKNMINARIRRAEGKGWANTGKE